VNGYSITLKNVADMPTEQEWLTYAEWGRKWGQCTCPPLFHNIAHDDNQVELFNFSFRAANDYP
jgi:hypothetical protein